MGEVDNHCLFRYGLLAWRREKLTDARQTDLLHAFFLLSRTEMLHSDQLGNVQWVMSIDKQHILHDLHLKESLRFSNQSTPLMFSRDSSMETLSSFNINFHSHNSTYTSEHSTNPSGILSPSDIPDSPPRGCDDDIDSMQQRLSHQPLNNTNSTGRTLIPCPERFTVGEDDADGDGDDADSIRNYTTSPRMMAYHDDGDVDDDDNDSIHSSLSSLTLPPPPSTSTAALLSNIQELKNMKRNLSVINEESLHEHHERRSRPMNISHTTTDDDDEDDDRKGKQLLFQLIRQRLPNHHISLTNASDTSSLSNNDEQHNKSKSSSSSSCINDQVNLFAVRVSISLRLLPFLFRPCAKVRWLLICPLTTSLFHLRPCRKVVMIAYYLLVRFPSDLYRMLRSLLHVPWQSKRNIDAMERTMIQCTARATQRWPTMTMSITTRKLVKLFYEISLLRCCHHVRYPLLIKRKNSSDHRSVSILPL